MESKAIIGVVAAYRRPGMLRNLLNSLRENRLLRKVIVVDNGADADTRQVGQESPVPVLYHAAERNLGCGGGVERGLRLGLQAEGATHFCLFDDDTEAAPGAVDALVEGMASASADVGVPLVLNREGFITWYAGLAPKSPAWDVIRRPRLRPADYCELCGRSPVPFTWAPWPMMALSASVVRECGYPRDDFWLCAEDLEYSLRLTHRHKGVLVPAAVCRHLPPPTSSGDEIGGPHYLRFCLMLQNLSYMCTRLPHARRSFRHLPGNYRRFIRTFGAHPQTFRDAALAWWRGGIRGKPAGQLGADGFKQRFVEYYQKLQQPSSSSS